MILKAFQRQLIRSTAIVVCTVMGSHTVAADDFVLFVPSVVTNGGSVLNGDDNLTIAGSGSISTTGGDAVSITGSDNTVHNLGAISTQGNNFDGIDAIDDSSIVNAGSIATQGFQAHGIDLNDDSIITNSGSIITQGNQAQAIDIRHNNTIVNSGTIITTGNWARAIDGLTGNTVINTGTIITTNTDGYGIWFGSNNILTNSGSITTGGLRGHAMSTDGNSTITNSGTISTAGNFAYGIWVYDSNTVTNTGQITTSGTQSHGFDARDNNTVVNSGKITTSGTNGDALWNRHNNSILNSGMLFTTGSNAHGIRGNNSNTITNSGKVISTQANSFDLGNNNTLNLLAPSFLGGVIDLGTNTTVNITTGPSHSILWDFSTGTMAGGAPTFGGTVPVFYNAATQKVATLDPTSLASSTDNLSDMSGNISNIVGQRLRGAFLDSSSGSANTSVGLNSFFDTRESGASKHKAFLPYDDVGSRDYLLSAKSWVTVMGAMSNYDGNSNTVDRSLNQWALAAGYDWSPSADMRLGIMGGYSSSTLNADSSFANAFDSDSSGFFAGIYGRKNLDTMFFDFAFTGGVTEHSSRRFVNDNLAPLGVAYATSDYNGTWISPEIAIGKHIDMGGWVATPTARLRYASQWLEGYSETGTSANAVIGGRQVAIGEGSLELAGTTNTDKGSKTLRVGYLYRTSFGDSATNVTMIGQTLSVPTFDEDRHAGYVGANMNINMTDSINLEFGAQLVASESFVGIGGNIKLLAKF